MIKWGLSSSNYKYDLLSRLTWIIVNIVRYMRTKEIIVKHDQQQKKKKIRFYIA